MSSDTVQRWLAERAVPIPSSVGSAVPIVGGEVDSADVVGLGAAVRHASDLVVAMRAVLDDLIARHGFRSLYLEGTDAPYNTGVGLDRFVVNGVCPTPLDVLVAPKILISAHCGEANLSTTEGR